MSKVKIDSKSIDGFNLLCCPKCGEGYMHQDSVEAYWRSKEDGVSRRDTSSKGILTSEEVSDRDEKSKTLCNPSDRRDGIRIWFSCEFCRDIKVWLTIVQHKGLTLVENGFIHDNGTKRKEF